MIECYFPSGIGKTSSVWEFHLLISGRKTGGSEHPSCICCFVKMSLVRNNPHAKMACFGVAYSTTFQCLSGEILYLLNSQNKLLNKHRVNCHSKQDKPMEVLATHSHLSYQWGPSESQGSKNSWCSCVRGFILSFVLPNQKGRVTMHTWPEGAKITLKGINECTYWWSHLTTNWFLVSQCMDS